MKTSVLNRSKQGERRLRLALALMFLLSVGVVAFGSGTAQAADPPPSFGNSSFRATWERTDQPIASGKTARSWYWGPQPYSISLTEKYADSPSGQREVQYFDKARMEINNPTRNQVTNGLLVVEMINGRRQEGDKLFVDGGAAVIPVAGDPTNTWPTYASLGSVYLQPRPLEIGQPVVTSFLPTGMGKQEGFKGDVQTNLAVKQNGLGIPQAFWEFLNRKGQVYLSGDYGEATISDWLFSTGLPVTEAYWTKVTVGGISRDVLFQAFERRLLTYTPSNPASFQVEMGNVGQAYVTWRYPKGLPQVSTPIANIFLGQQPQWYEVTGDVLNVRTAPNTDAPNPERTATHPYLQKLFKGNRVQVLRSVKGEEIEKGNDLWYQFYEKPDLFVYSGYVRKMNLQDLPTPAKTYAGVWVTVDLTRQMLGVYDGTRLIYKTFIASGIPNDDPLKDHSTPTGTYKIDGSYRPKSQTMEGGTADKAIGGDYYKIDDIRYVNYFFQDYAIHGSYWHARFGTYPQSHGCVNATDYDASLIFQLKAGTPVVVFRESGAAPNQAG